MKIKINRGEAKKKIDNFFQRDNFNSEEMRKIRRLAMKFNIKLGEYRRLFCKSCLSQLKGRTRISKTHKTIICENCSYKNKFKIA